MLKLKGPITELCGTIWINSFQDLKVLLIFTLCFLLDMLVKTIKKLLFALSSS